jgi:PPOX class probable F420-dependent enzyme
MTSGNEHSGTTPGEEIHASLAIRRPETLDEPAARLLRARNFVVVCTIAKSGAIQAKPMWVDTDGEHVILNSEIDRGWVRNLQRDPRVTCTVMNLEVPYEFVEISGRALPPSVQGGVEHADFLAAKYLGLEEYPHHDPDNPRVLVKVVPERIIHMSPPVTGPLQDALEAATPDTGSTGQA